MNTRKAQLNQGKRSTRIASVLAGLAYVEVAKDGKSASLKGDFSKWGGSVFAVLPKRVSTRQDKALNAVESFKLPKGTAATPGNDIWERKGDALGWIAAMQAMPTSKARASVVDFLYGAEKTKVKLLRALNLYGSDHTLEWFESFDRMMASPKMDYDNEDEA